ncbi:MAG TPA: YDG domain-containing protein [Rhodanobacter sp.]|jgi:filamentous hemagglutinin family protein|nr:YDG domain-containing protein [Rhodanobacter sp.]
MKRASLNHVYRVVWSQALQMWVVVAENAKGRSKSASCKLATIALSLAAAMAHAQTAPTGGRVVSGAGSITHAGATTTITQTSQNLSINWASFNIAPTQTVNFLQPSATAIAVNRIFDPNGTQILGHLNANGQVFLINPNGILFGRGAQVNVGGLVASTLDVNDATLSSAVKTFDDHGSGDVINQGSITAAHGGYVALLGNHVSNQGVISAQLGAVALGAGSAVTLTFNDSSLVHMQVDQSVLSSLAENGGVIQADGGRVIMAAGARDALLASVVNNTGVIEAHTVANHGGTITLLGGMQAGTVHVDGNLDASAPDGGHGGIIETSAAHVEVANKARVTTAAAMGLYGSWLIDPQDYTVAASGGDITGAALSSNLGTTNVTLLSSNGATAGSGNVNVNDAVSWNANTTLTLTASNNVNINANITATGNTAGLVINPNTANGSETASGTGVYNLGNGASITLPGTNPSLSIAGTAYIVINSLGAASDATTAPATPTLQGLAAPTTNMAGHFALGSNIDATATSGWNAGAGFTPIGASTAFSGTFDGLGHTIGGLTINRPSTSLVGLFAIANAGAEIRNIGLAGGSVIGNSDVGGLVGIGIGSFSIDNSYSTGSVSGNSSLGGLVGAGGDVAISNSFTTGSVSGPGAFVGGLLGYGSATDTVNNSYTTGNVAGSNYVGGLAGNLQHGSINNSYVSGRVTGGGYTGALVGFSYGSVNNSYATSSNNGSLPLAASTSFTTVNNSSFLTNAQLETQASFASWDFANTWVMYQGLTAPLLRSFMTPLEVTANNATKTYNAQAFTGGNGVSYTGPANGNLPTTPNGNLLGTVSYSGTSQGAINAGSYVITPSGLYSNQFGYIISYGPDAALTVNRAPLTLAAATNTKTYDGTTSAAAAPTTVGLLGSDTVSALTEAYTNQNAGTGKTLAVNAGYTVNDGNGGNNYIVSAVVNTSGVITPAPLTLTAATNTKTYDGSVSAAAAPTITGLIGSDTINGLTEDYATPNAGAGKTLAVNAGYTVNDGNSGNNYIVNTVANTTGVITARVLTVAGEAATNKVYDGTTADPLIGGSLMGVVAGDTVTLSEAGNFTSRNVGTGITVIAADSLSGTSVGNYTLMQPTGLAANITAATLTLTATTNTKTYDGTTSAAAAPTIAGLVGSDTISGVAEDYADPNAGTGKTLAVNAGYTVNDGNSGNNYIVSTIANTTGVITPKMLTVAGEAASNKVYDGTTADLLIGGSLMGVVAGDTVTLSDAGSFTSKNVGTGIAVIAADSLSGTSVGNYTLMQPTGLAANITAAPLTLTATTNTKTYDGTNSAAAAPIIAGLVGSDTISGVAEDYADPNAGTGKTLAVNAGYTINDGNGGSNYTVSTVANTTGVINKAQLIYVASPVSPLVGQSFPALTGTLVGFVPGDSQANATTGTLVWTTTANGSSLPGQYAIDGSGLGAANYVFVQDPANASALTVLPRTVEADLCFQLDNQPKTIISAHRVGQVPGTGCNASLVVRGEPTLRIVNGGIALPSDMINVTASTIKE